MALEIRSLAQNLVFRTETERAILSPDAFRLCIEAGGTVHPSRGCLLPTDNGNGNGDDDGLEIKPWMMVAGAAGVLGLVYYFTRR